jgi:cytochrome d ubiquinol oxidase subunit II
VLVPSLVLLFRLFLRGRLDPADTPGAGVASPSHAARKEKPRLLPAFAGATLVIGLGATVIADGGWVLALGVLCLFACAISTFGLAATEPEEKI